MQLAAVTSREAATCARTDDWHFGAAGGMPTSALTRSNEKGINEILREAKK